MPDLPGYLTPSRRRAMIALAARLSARLPHHAPDPNRVSDDDERDELLAPLVDEQVAVLDAVCEARATTLTAHRARAASFFLWDGGELAWRAHADGFLEDRLLCALLRDLVEDEAVAR